MSCSGEIVAENDLLQIKPAVTKKLKKAKYGIADHSTVELCHWTKKSFRGEGNCYKHKFYGYQRTNAWNFHLLECTARTDVSIAGDRWNFTNQWRWTQTKLQNQKTF